MHADSAKHSSIQQSPAHSGIDYAHYSQRAASLRSRAFTSAWGRVAAALRQWKQTWNQQRREKRALAELMRLDAHELKDLGLNRGDLERLRHGAWTTSELDAEKSRSTLTANETKPQLRVVPGRAQKITSGGADHGYRKCG